MRSLRLSALRSIRGRLTLAAALVLVALGAAAWRQVEVWASMRATWRSNEDVLAAYAQTAAWTYAGRLERARDPDAAGPAPPALPDDADAPLLPPALLGPVRSCEALRVAVHAPRGAARLHAPACGGDATVHRVAPQVVTVGAGPFAGWRVVAQATPALAAHVRRAHGRREAIVLATGLAVLAGAGALLVLADLRRHEQVSRMRGDFVAAISHDLRTPLAHVALVAETLRLERERSPAERAYLLGVISRETERLRAMVDRVVAFAAGERGALALRPEPTDLLEQVTLAVDAARRLAPPETAFAVAEEGAEAWALVDRAALAQVLGNLLDNAAKYGPGTQRIQVTVGTRGADAVIVVDDQGPGIPPRERGRVLQPFQRGSAAAATGGAGLGLALARDLVTRMDGRLTIEDASGGGARLVVALPAVRVHGDAAGAGDSRAAPAAAPAGATPA